MRARLDEPRRQPPGRARRAPPRLHATEVLTARVALTFDDGPGDWTPVLLDLLRDHGARATFFVLGAAIAGREETLRRAVAEGHELGNHTWSHRHPAELSDEELLAEVARTGAEVERAAGVRPRLLRPPYGEEPERFRRIGETALWTIEPEDWREPPADEVVARVLDALEPGATVLLHDGFRAGPSDRSHPTVDAVAALLPALRERGYGCVTLHEL